MENWSKDKLIMEINKLKQECKYLQTKLRDLVTAYKSLSKEKDALESGLQVFHNILKTDSENSEKHTEKDSTGQSSSETSSVNGEEQNFSIDVSTLMHSLTALSAEKSHMEATFQADKKQLRQEKEKYENLARDLQERLRIVGLDCAKEIEHLKSCCIVLKHEKENEQHENKIAIRELQNLLSQEREEKLFLEHTLSELASKEEVERFKEIDIKEKFINLQEKHMLALEQERKKTLQYEIEVKACESAYEERVAVLENRLAELSNTLVKYNQKRQQDQKEILKLRDHINEMSSGLSRKSLVDASIQTKSTSVGFLLADEDRELTFRKQAVARRRAQNRYNEEKSFVTSSFEKSLGSDLVGDDSFGAACSDSDQGILEKIDVLRYQENQNELDNLKIKIRMLTDQNLVFKDTLDKTVARYERQLDDVREQYMSLCTKYDDEIHTLEMKYKLQILDLEVQVQKQRDRTLALLDEKEQEVSTLKSSFQLFVPGSNPSIVLNEQDDYSVNISQLDGVLSEVSNQSSQENPHILHYAHELARKDVVITGLRKNCGQLENSLRDMKKELIVQRQANLDQVSNLNKQISRLECCQSREGANLEYLKNIFVNYLHTKDTSSKRHMLNAIAAVLKLTDSEISKIKKAL